MITDYSDVCLKSVEDMEEKQKEEIVSVCISNNKYKRFSKLKKYEFYAVLFEDKVKKEFVFESKYTIPNFQVPESE